MNLIGQVEHRVLAGGLGFVESPRWHDELLWVSDMATHEILAITPDAMVERICRLDDQPSGLGWMPDETMLVVSMRERKLLRFRGGRFSVHCDLAPMVSADLNDMVVDADGRAYVTNFGYEADGHAVPVSTGVIVVHPDGRADPPIGDLFRPNGCAITCDGRTLLVAETRVHRLTAFDRHGDGSISGQRPVGTLPGGTWADGICVDVADGTWIADPKGRHCYRMTLEGEITDAIDTAPFQAIACALGGYDGRTLFVTVGHIRPFPEMARDRLAEIHAYRVDVPGPATI